jgi:outer membrane autotransporter protein
MPQRAHYAVLLTLALLGATVAPASAQVSTTRGWSLGFQLQGASLTIEGEDADAGGGAGLRAGYGLNRIVTLFVAFDGASVEADNAPDDVAGKWTLGHVDLGARFYFANALRRWIPYLEAAVGARVVSLKDALVEGDRTDVNFSGSAVTVGGGLAVYLKQTFSLDAGVKFSTGEFTDIQVGAFSRSGLDIDAKSYRFGLGLTWWP